MTTKYRRVRSKANFLVTVATTTGKQVGEIVDVNEYGARFSGVHGLKRGDTIQFNVLFHSLRAQVQWATEEEAGVSFCPKLDTQTLFLIRQATCKVGTARFDSRTLREMR